jgi:hypothetical protein
MGTPTPSSQGGNGRKGDPGSDDDDGPPKKKSKKDSSFKKDKKDKSALDRKLILKMNNKDKDGIKKLSKGATSNPLEKENGKRDRTPNKKREREVDSEDAPLSKKAKLERTDSSTGSP